MYILKGVSSTFVSLPKSVVIVCSIKMTEPMMKKMAVNLSTFLYTWMLVKGILFKD